MHTILAQVVWGQKKLHKCPLRFNLNNFVSEKLLIFDFKLNNDSHWIVNKVEVDFSLEIYRQLYLIHTVYLNQ